MQVTLDIPDKIAEKAQAEGGAVDIFVRRLIDKGLNGDGAFGTARLGPPTMTPAEAAADIREMRSSITLGGIKIKDLIEEGHRY